MSLTLAIDNVTATGCRLNYSSITGSPSTIEVQISPRPDFAFCVCPVFTTPTSTPQTIAGLNQSQNYYARARGVTGAGVQLAWSNIEPFRTPQSAPQDVTPASVFLDPALIVVPEPIISMTGANILAGYPAINLLDDGPSATIHLGQGGGNNVHSFYARTAGGEIDTIALLNTNMPENASTEIFYGDTFAGLVNLRGTFAGRASANLPGRMGYHGLYRFTPTAAQWWMIRVTGTTPGQRLQAGHLVLGKSLVSKRIARDMSISFEDLGSMDRNSFGIPDRLIGLRTRVVDIDIAMLDEAIYEALYSQIHARVGSTEPMLIVPNPKANAFLHDRILYGTMSGGRVINPISKFFSRRFQISSII